MVHRVSILAIALLVQTVFLPAQQSRCTASSPLASFKLYVKPPQYAAYPLREVNEILPGMKIQYQPVHISGDDPKDARIALILAESARGVESQRLLVLEPRRANETAEWEVPFRTEMVALVYGPQGLSESKVGDLVKKDAALIKELANYAEQNERIEDLLNLLAEAERSPRSGENLEAALAGFAARHGMPMTQLDRQASTSDQALALMRALNPTLSTYDPLTPSSSQRLQQSAGLAASVAGLFWGSQVALYAGGAGLFLNLRSLMFPGSEFRSALLQSADDQQLTLCAKSEQHKSRTRIGYLWASRVTDVSAPAATISGKPHIGAGLEAVVPLRLSEQTEWKHISRAREWRLVSADGKKEIPVTVNPDTAARSLRFRVPRSTEPGLYQLAARWDWGLVRPNGWVQVHKLPNGPVAELSKRSLQNLVEGASNVEIAVEGAEFRFVEEARLARKDDPYSTPRVVPHRLVPEKGSDSPRLFVLLDGPPLSQGMWQLSLKQTGGQEIQADVPVLPQPPVLKGLPIKLNRGVRGKVVELTGERMELIAGLEAEGVTFTPVLQGEGAVTSSNGSLTFHADVSTDAAFSGKQALRVRLKDRDAPIVLEGAVEILGPLPVLVSAQIAHREQNGVELQENELPVGSLVTTVLRTRTAGSSASLRLSCRDGYMENQAVVLRAGQTSPDARLQLTSPDTFHLTFDPGRVGQHGCTLETQLENENGRSEALYLGRVVRLPRLESLTLTDELMGDNLFAGTLTGQDLESIAAVGWVKENPVPVNSIPRPIQGDSRNQELRVSLPWPSPTPRSPILIWLREESEGRLTKTRAGM